MSEEKSGGRFHDLETLNKYRTTKGPWGTKPENQFGLFNIPSQCQSYKLQVISSPFDDKGWQHVSVSTTKKCPTWEDMCKVKRLFWGPDVAVFEFHPPEKDYVNMHRFCLHMWRHTENIIELPPSILVGFKGVDHDQVSRM